MKFNFIKIILYQHDFSAAKDFYANHLSFMMKKIYGEKSDSFYKKNYKYINFLNVINTSQTKFIYLQNHYKFENHLDKFMNLLEKDLEKSRRNGRNPVIFNVTKAKTSQNKDTNEMPISDSNSKKSNVIIWILIFIGIIIICLLAFIINRYLRRPRKQKVNELIEFFDYSSAQNVQKNII